ncbi:MAG: SMC-Scp complex subunit ScpB [Chloroflexi bacterium]|nr:SMC-Scp complex subunit ScpB [Chloroflexota bacterium]
MLTPNDPLAANGLNSLAKLEALLFVAPGPVLPGQLAEALEISPRDLEKALEALEAEYAGRGLRLQRHRGRVQLTSAPEAAPLVERFLNLDATTRLSQAALETLAIIAYQQPVTRPQIDSIRGVNSDSVMKSLLSGGLIEESGRTEGPGRPILYSTTSEFLQHFGLAALKDLPPLEPPDMPALDASPNGESPDAED